MEAQTRHTKFGIAEREQDQPPPDGLVMDVMLNVNS